MSQFVIESIMNREIWKGEAGSIREAVEAAARSGANLQFADLRSANLRSANLRSANLRSANLRSANLQFADLRSVREDFRAVLEAAPKEVPGLRRALLLGNVDGSTYTGACACLVGTIANVRGVVHTSLLDLRPDANRPAERWFLAIKEGDSRRNNQVVAITLGWIDEWLAKKGIVVPKRPKVVGEVGRLMLQMAPGQRREMLREARARGPR